MGRYALSRKALRDMASIITYLHREASPAVADQIEERLFAEFSDLAEGRVPGHTRPDLTSKKILFHFVKPYMVVFRRTRQNVQIVHIVRASRDMTKFL